MTGYTARDVAKLLGLSAGQVRGYVRSGFLEPARGVRGELLFSFQDLVLLRTAKELVDARIAPLRVRRVLKKLKDGLPTGRPLTGISIAAEGNRVVVRDGKTRFNAENGQALFDFQVSELARSVEPLTDRAVQAAMDREAQLSAEEWHSLGCHLEVTAPGEARDAYRRAIELDPHHVDGHTNLGRLLHEAEELEAAEAHYRLALASDPSATTAAYNLGVVLEDRGEPERAIGAYEQALEHDPRLADAHYNLARIYEELGKRTLALRHLKSYKTLVQG